MFKISSAFMKDIDKQNIQVDSSRYMSMAVLVKPNLTARSESDVY